MFFFSICVFLDIISYSCIVSPPPILGPDGCVKNPLLTACQSEYVGKNVSVRKFKTNSLPSSNEPDSLPLPARIPKDEEKEEDQEEE